MSTAANLRSIPCNFEIMRSRIQPTRMARGGGGGACTPSPRLAAGEDNRVKSCRQFLLLYTCARLRAIALQIYIWDYGFAGPLSQWRIASSFFSWDPQTQLLPVPSKEECRNVGYFSMGWIGMVGLKIPNFYTTSEGLPGASLQFLYE